jgi:hypothetical protein
LYEKPFICTRRSTFALELNSMGTELTFDFITDDQFRTSLESDHREMGKAIEAGAWKAVHVLAGSIVEALLVEYLVVSKIRPNGKDPLTIKLSEAIEACKDAKVITPRTASLSDVVRDYRNLIHPGRVIRLQDSFGESSARIALSLVEIIAAEVAQKRRENYGLTAEQIVRKISIDERALPLIPNLLSETNEHERRRLVNGIIADTYSAEGSDWLGNPSTLNTLKKCYRLALSSLSEDEQAQVASRFAKMVREESSEKITSYADAFFSCEDLRHLRPKDKAIVKNHIFARLEGLKIGDEVPPGLLETLMGIGPHLEDSDVAKFANVCARYVLHGTEESQKRFSALASDAYDHLASSELKSKLEKQIDSWLTMAKGRKFPPEKIKRLEQLSANCSEFPF